MPTPVPNPFDVQQPVTEATTTPWQVTGDKTGDQTVEGRAASIVQADSPLMQLARTRADQQANARGLINSNLAVGAGQTAVMDQATKIASQDAATAADAAKTNAMAANSNSQFNADAKNKQGIIQANLAADTQKMAQAQGYDLERMNQQQSNDMAKMTAEFTNQQRAALEKFGFDKQLVEIQKASNAEVAAMEASYKNLTQASAAATSIVNGVTTNVQRIMENESMDAAAKQAAIDIINTNANKALQMIGAISGDLDLVAYFDEVLADVPPNEDSIMPISPVGA